MNRYSRQLVCWLLLIVTVLLIGVSASADDIQYVTSDIRILYLYEDPATIDWPTLYYLNERFGCRIDLLTLQKGSASDLHTAFIENKEIYSHCLYVPFDFTGSDKLPLGELFESRYPDILILDNVNKDELVLQAAEYLKNLPHDTTRIFNILKIYQLLTPDQKKLSDKDVVLNSRELYHRYSTRMKFEIPRLSDNFNPDYFQGTHLTRYDLIKDNMATSAYENNFLSGITPFRLREIIDSLFADSPMKTTLLQQAFRIKTYFSNARFQSGRQQVENCVKGFRELRSLNQHQRVEREYPVFQKYLNALLKKAEDITLKKVGLNWDGKIVLRDSPHGPRLKFIVSLSVDGPMEVELSKFLFHPYWEEKSISLDTISITIPPHQTFIKEYLLELDRKYLEGEIPDSLKFTVEVNYGGIPLTFSSAIPLWEAPELQIALEPEFYFIKPFPELDIDRVVSQLNLKLVISKPKDYSGEADIEFETPRGMFAGSYRKTITLDKTIATKTVRIPFTISNLFELGVQHMTATLQIGGKPVAVDSGRIRIASCDIPDTRQVGFLPDSLGLIEDILSMTDAAYRPLTDRSLIKADLDAYDVIIIGSGSFRNYPSFGKLKDRFEQYLKGGGSLVIFAQPDDWPGEIVPVSIVPTAEILDKTEITNRIPEARILSQPYPISEKNLLSVFYKKQALHPAVISPSERVFVSPSGATFLSVSRIGDGQIIYCGLPLTELVAQLDIDAIHLFANILNY